MTKYKVRVKVFRSDLVNYYTQNLDCKVEQIFKSPDENIVVFEIKLPEDYIIRSKSELKEAEDNARDEFGNQLDILSDEISEFSSEVTEAIDLVGEELENIELDREDLEKIKKLRADLEKIKLEFGEIL